MLSLWRGGNPLDKKISFAGPSITQREVDYVLDAVQNGWYDNYNTHIKRLERSFADYIGVGYAIATHCCTAALHLAAHSLGLGPGDEVIVTDCSWIATAYAVAYTGAQCVFVDIDPETWCIDPACIRAAITPKTRAIMLVHTFGHPAAMDEIMAISREHGLAVIEDAAPAIGSTYRGKRVGGFGNAACFSFQGAKMTASGEGGVFVTDDPVLYERARLLAGMGRTDSRYVFWCDSLGYKYTMNNLTTALALAQLERVEELMAKKRALYAAYHECLAGRPGLKLLEEQPGCTSNYCYPSLLLADADRAGRDAVLAGLRRDNIQARPAFPRMSRFPVFQARFENPVAGQVEAQGISLPAAANLTTEDVHRVCERLISLLEG
jgi:perosamine synthetase